MRLILKILMGLSVLSSPSYADEISVNDKFYCQERGLGSNFYCKPPKPEPEKKPIKEDPKPVVQEPVEDPVLVDLKNFQDKLVRTRKKAVWDPTKDNVREYMLLQIEARQKAKEFSTTFAQLTWQEPELSYTVNNPMNSVGKTQWKSTRRNAISDHMAELSQRYGLFYFFSSDCPACRAFGPILKEFSTIHNIEVMAISMDGGPSMSFSDWEPNNGISVRLGMEGTITPSVVLFDRITRQAVPISAGVISLEDIENRIFILTGRDKQPKFTKEY